MRRVGAGPSFVRAFASLLLLLTLHGSASHPEGSPSRVIVLGFDGMDPGLAERWMRSGVLPNFARVAKVGRYQHLPTTNPAQSPVAWASFATGLHPGDHGIFDFVTRDPASYSLQSGLASEAAPNSIVVFGIRLPLEYPHAVNRRSGTPFWMTMERRGHPSSVLRVPASYPPDPIHRMLSGMGVPDLLGTQGTFTFFSADANDDRPGAGGRVVIIKGNDDEIVTSLEGPSHPLFADDRALSVPLVLRRMADSTVKITLGGRDVVLSTGQWSNWIQVSFRFLGFMNVASIVRLHLVQGFPVPKLYVSPMQLDPREASSRISSPSDFAAQLAERIGLFHTAGMAEETWSLNEERIDDHAYLEMIKTVLAEREAMFFDSLTRDGNEVVVTVFEQTDRVSHMFWRGIDPSHPRFADAGEEARGAIRWIYGEADRIVGKTLAAMRPGDRLIILSDHGFAPFRRSVHLNRWLAQAGLLAVRPGAAGGAIDWARTKAYAIGLNGVFINRSGREVLGMVGPEEAAQIKQHIIQELPKLRDERDGGQIVLSVSDRDDAYRGIHRNEAPDLVIGYASGYRASWETALGLAPREIVEDNRSKWSGDHLIEPSLVPGVLFTSFKGTPVSSIAEMPTLVNEALDLPARVIVNGATKSEPAPPASSPNAIAQIPLVARLLLLACLASVCYTLLYRYLIDQARLDRIGLQSSVARRKLLSADLTFGELRQLIFENYRLISVWFWVAGRPAFIAALPAAALTIWIANVDNLKFPAAGERIAVEVVPAAGYREPVVQWRGTEAVYESGYWRVVWPQAGQTADLVNHDGTVLLTLPTASPVETVGQASWWRNLFGNSAGDLPTPGDVGRIWLHLPARTAINFGPKEFRKPSVIFLILVAAVAALAQWARHLIMPRSPAGHGL